MVKYLIVKKENVVEVENFTDSKDIIFTSQGIINFEELNKSSSEQDIFKIPQKNQKELTEKGETEFMIITKTIVTLKKESRTTNTRL